MNSERNIYLETSFILLTALLKFVFIDWLKFSAYYIITICLFWTFYLIKRYKNDPGILKHWGFQKENFRQSFLFLLPIAIVSMSCILIYGYINHSNVFNWHVIPILILYPFWGLIQQFMVIALIAGNMIAIKTITFKKYQIAFMASLLFAGVHYPSSILMIYAFILEMVFIFVYFKWKNLWSLALFHGWISGLLIFYVLERDLLLELLAGMW